MVEGDILDFARRATPGQALSYGRGDRPPSDLVKAMRGLVDAGVLVPIAKREGGSMHFMVQRGHADFDRAMGARRTARGRVRQRRVRKTSLSMVFECLVRAARAGKPCPTNEELAVACGLSGKLSASYRMRKLVAAGKIALVDHSPWGRRVVTILAGPCAGRSTIEASL